MTTDDDLARDPELAARAWGLLVPSRLAWARVDDFEGEVAETLAGWTKAEPVNLVIFGEATGVGKSHAAVAAVRPLWERGLDLMFIPEGEMFTALKRDFEVRPGPGETFAADDLMDVDVLVIDDLGASRLTEWSIEQLYNLINRRWLEELRTVATTNLTPAQLEEALGSRSFSRLVGSEAVSLYIAGEDRRRRHG